MNFMHIILVMTIAWQNLFNIPTWTSSSAVTMKPLVELRSGYYSIQGVFMPCYHLSPLDIDFLVDKEQQLSHLDRVPPSKSLYSTVKVTVTRQLKNLHYVCTKVKGNNFLLVLYGNTVLLPFYESVNLLHKI